MVVQTTYTATIGAAYAGMLADINPRTVVSLIAEGSAVGFGLALTQGTADDQATLGGTAVFKGISLRDLTLQAAALTGDIAYAVGETMSAINEGYCYVNIPAASGAIGAPLKFIQATGVITVGTVGAGETLVPGGTLEQTVSVANTIALIKLA